MLNIAASGGSPTRMAAPVTLMFLRNRLLVSGISTSPWGRGNLRCDPLEKLRRANQRDQQFFESVSRVTERGECVSHGLSIGGGFHAAECVAEQLLDDAFLARAAVGEQTSDRF